MGLNVKAFLDDPPAKLDINKILGNGIEEKYLGKVTASNKYDDGSFTRVMRLFGDSMGIAYMAWFN